MEKTLQKDNLKIAIQKDGRLTEESLSVLRSMGLEVEAYGRRLFASCRNYPVDILFCRDDDIPGYIESGVADLGIVGRNIITEQQRELPELLSLGFGYCRLVVAVANESGVVSPSQLEGCRIATSFPETTRRYFAEQGVSVDIVEIAGAVEITPALGVADAVVDLVATGSTMVMNDLRVIATVLETEAVLVGGTAKLRVAQQRLVDQLMARLQAVAAAKNLKYVTMNIPEQARRAVEALLPGVTAPTIVALAREGWRAAHVVADEDSLWAVMPQLRALGVEGLVILPIEKVVL